MNEWIAYNCHKLKRNGLINGCFSRNGIVRIKHEERVRQVKIFPMEKLHQLFPNFDFGDPDEDDAHNSLYSHDFICISKA